MVAEIFKARETLQPLMSLIFIGSMGTESRAHRHGRRILAAADEDCIHSLIKAWASIHLDEIQEGGLGSACGVSFRSLPCTHPNFDDL